ncbi:MAG: SURF1 family protein [Rhodospirillaceae bacterium]|nr:SURF1 family protein [Rhodospirillaceae bacterium]
MRRPGLWSICLTLFGLVLMLYLGVWQLQRKAWKDGLIAEMAAGITAPPLSLAKHLDELQKLNYRAVRLQGRFLHKLEAYLGPRVHQGQAGLHVLTPFQMRDGPVVLVNRGWIPPNRRDPTTRTTGQVTGDVTLDGVLRSDLQQGPWTPDYDAKADQWFWYDISGISQNRKIDLISAVVQADSTDIPGGLPIGGGAQPKLKNDHLQYALTWFSLSVVLLIVFIVSHRRKGDEA